MRLASGESAWQAVSTSVYPAEQLAPAGCASAPAAIGTVTALLL
jgi:hypothetical protein